MIRIYIFQSDLILIIYKKKDEWYIEWQRMTTNDNEWQRVAMSGTTSENEWYNK